jgi:lipopolysaccharide export system protein LptA
MSKKRALQFLLSVFISVSAAFLHAQNQMNRIQLIHTDALEYNRAITDAQRLLGNVILESDGTRFYADSAYLYPNDNFEGFSNIRIEGKEGYQVTGNHLDFNKQSETAVMTQNVVFTDDGSRLFTNHLTYHLKSETAVFIEGGKIISAGDELESKTGIYETRNNLFRFRSSVKLKNQDYQVLTDTMHYHTLSERSDFMGYTIITSDSGTIECELGQYESKSGKSKFLRNVEMRSNDNILCADTLYYDKFNELGDARGRVTLIDSTDTYEVHGEKCKYDAKAGTSHMTDSAVFITQSPGDTLYMHADTLFSIRNSVGQTWLMAHRRMKFFSNTSQGMADSAVFRSADSTLRMYYHPVVWSEAHQLTADSIILHLKNGTLQQLAALGHSFLAEEYLNTNADTTGPKFNQIKGKQIDAYFYADTLHHAVVNGNAQMIYFPENNTGEEQCVNTSQCSQIKAFFSEKKITAIILDKQPDSVYSPVSKVKLEDLQFPDFHWKSAIRPREIEDIFQHTIGMP